MTRPPLLAMAVAVAAIIAPPVVGTTPRLVWNASPSVPRGVYVVDRRPARIGDLVLVRLPDDLATFAARRAYLPRGAFLIKPVAAQAGATVCRYGRSIFVRGQLVATALAVDGAGRWLPSWSGCRTLQSGQVFLLSPHPDGFDSRYFGALASEAVVGRAVRFTPAFGPGHPAR
jgi:conjugative transfer signal peptidase TraF